jgi:hypothetical protein
VFATGPGASAMENASQARETCKRSRDEVQRQADGGQIGLMWDGGLCIRAEWVCLGAVCATALAHAVVCRRRRLNGNQISTIASGTFSGLTVLTELYGPGLWVLG